MALSFDISPSNNCVAFGDEHSGISLYSASGNSKFFYFFGGGGFLKEINFILSFLFIVMIVHV